MAFVSQLKIGFEEGLNMVVVVQKAAEVHDDRVQTEDGGDSRRVRHLMFSSNILVSKHPMEAPTRI